MPARRLFLPPALVLGALTACAPAAKPPPGAAASTVDTAAVMVGVAGLWDRWAVADTAEDLEAFVGMMADDTRLDLQGFPPMVGREAIRAHMAPVFAQVDYLEASASPERTVVVAGNRAHQAGTWRERYTTKGKPGEMTDYGRYAAVFVRGADGQWHWAYMMAMVDSTLTGK